MDKLRIYDETLSNYIEMPQAIFELGGTLEYSETTMASGKRVRDILGFRPKISVTWGYMPQATLTALIGYLRTCSYLKIDYPDQDGSDKSAMFSASYPTTKIFKFVDGVPMWYNVTVEFEGQEVE